MDTAHEAAARLAAADDILILTHRRPDGDTVGSAAALCHALRQIGKTAYLLPNEDATPIFHPYFEGLTAPEGFAPRFVVTVDTAAAGMLPDSAAAYLDSVDLVIDHHGTNRGYGKHNCVDASCAACGELMYRIILALGAALTAEIATLLYVAVSTDTGCFVYSNTTADTHRVVAALMDADIPFAAVNKRHFRTKSLRRLKLECLILDEMHLHHGGMVAMVPISAALIARAGATQADLEDISAYVGQVEGVKISATLQELAPGQCKVSLRATPQLLDASAACADLGGGGHKGAAGCSVAGTMAEAEAAVLAAVERHMVRPE